MVGLRKVGELFSLPSSEVCEDVLRLRPGKLLPSLMKVSRGQLLTFKEALEGQVLDGWRRDRRTIVHVTVDNYGPPAVPTPPAQFPDHQQFQAAAAAAAEQRHY